MIKYLVWSLLCFIAVGSTAQVTVSGHVYDNRTQEPLAFATIALGNQILNADVEGLWSLTANPGEYAIRITHIGYDSLVDSVVVEFSSLHLDVGLHESLSVLGEVVVAADGEEDSEYLPMIKAELQKISEIQIVYSSPNASALLGEFPGVRSIKTGSNAGQPAVRGLYGARIGFVVDGIPLQFQQWGDDHGLGVDSWQLERVSLVKGGSALTYGPRASAGAITVSPNPMLDSSGVAANVFSRFSSVNDQFEYGGALNWRFNKFQLDVVAGVRQNDNVKVPAESFVYLTRDLPITNNELKNTDGKSISGQFRLRWVNNKGGGRITYRGYYDRYGLFPGIIGIPDARELREESEPTLEDLPSMDVRSHSVIYRGFRELSPGKELVLIGALQQVDRKELGEPHGHGNAPVPDTDLALSILTQTASSSVFWRKRAGNYKLNTGFQIELSEEQTDGYEHLVPSSNYWQAGAFAAVNEYKIGKYELSAGWRLDASQVNVDGFTEPVYNDFQEIVGSNTRSIEVDQTWVIWGANVLVSRKFDAHRDLQFQMAKTSSFKTAYELSANGVHHGTFRHEKGSSSNKPENGYQLDAQWRYFGASSSFSAAGFAGAYQNFIYLTPAAEFSDLPEAGQLYQFDAARVFRYGGEINYTQSILNRHVDLTQDLEFVYAYRLDDGLALPFTPPVRSRTSFVYHMTERTNPNRLDFRASATYTAAQNQVARNEETTSDYMLWDMALIGRITERITENDVKKKKYGQDYYIEVAFSVNNLFDRKYIDHLSRYNLLDLPEAGRNFSVSLRGYFN